MIPAKTSYSPNHPGRPPHFMKIECVIVCVNYSDFLAHTLPQNLHYLDKIVIVTTPEDQATQRLCAQYSVDCIKTRIFYEDGDSFNKGRGINLGLSHLRQDDWVLHLDADILLPHRFRDMLARAKLNPQNIYGADRCDIVGYQAYSQNQHRLTPQFTYHCLVTPPSQFPVGSRLIHGDYGYCPIGYFQLWNQITKRIYPIHEGSAEHTDVLFAVQWARENRVLLPEFFVSHLSSEPGPMGANWNGRKSPPFK